ncbi:hypothetical protein [Aquibacillus salsiterrae]|uniref:Uncharacterized protein n=1 Tax=Aquibacillus salsiterrae TaxID=2950439 RepID=A0A9X3WIS5_9BACI|nr:hypothetical protein [Aquibacillus salsiterrae]MDC3418144.1 hypothetical protein [Aquibacillus salsiterrae]
MKKNEWFVALTLITTGIICLTFSASAMWGAKSINTYLATFIKLCLWLGIPIVLFGLTYFFFVVKKGK